MMRTRAEIFKGDITMIPADAIVNAANTSLLGGSGVDGAIHRAGGYKILEECKKIIYAQGGCKTGAAVITTAGNLPAKFVIHTVGPIWNGGNKNEAKYLACCYTNSLELALEYNCKTVSFPCISTGAYRFPKNEAARIAVDTVLKFLEKTDKIEKVIFVCFDDENYYFIKSQLNFKMFTIPAKLFVEKEVIGTIDIGLADSGMGVLSGHLQPNKNYQKFREILRQISSSADGDAIIRISQFTEKNDFKVIADDGIEFKYPSGGLIIYDFKDEPIEVELLGVDNEIWSRYFM